MTDNPYTEQVHEQVHEQFGKAHPRTQKALIQALGESYLDFVVTNIKEESGLDVGASEEEVVAFMTGDNPRAKNIGHLAKHSVEILEAYVELIQAYESLIGCVDEAVQKKASDN